MSDTTAVATRETATQAALANRAGFDLANLTDEEFEQGLARIEIRQKRMAKILDTVLIEGVHYGNPKNAFPKDILYQGGAEELRNLFRFKGRHTAPMIIVETADYCSVTVTMGLEDASGQILGSRTGSCNTMEKRFEKRNKEGFTYKDAREMLHQCLAMAEKRALAFITKEVTGANAFFAADEEGAMREALGVEEAVIEEPWSDEEKKKFYADAIDAGVKTKKALLAFLHSVVGDSPVGKTDIPKLYEALASLKAKAAPKQEQGDAAELTSEESLAADAELASEK